MTIGTTGATVSTSMEQIGIAAAEKVVTACQSSTGYDAPRRKGAGTRRITNASRHIVDSILKSGFVSRLFRATIVDIFVVSLIVAALSTFRSIDVWKILCLNDSRIRFSTTL